jgi:hypothetical protein
MRKLGRLAIIGLCLGAAPAALAQTPPLCGLQKGAVVDGRDPDGRDRLLVSIPSLGSAPVWAERVFHRKPLRPPRLAMLSTFFLKPAIPLGWSSWALLILEAPNRRLPTGVQPPYDAPPWNRSGPF